MTVAPHPPLPLGEREGPTTKSWEGEGSQASGSNRQFNWPVTPWIR